MLLIGNGTKTSSCLGPEFSLIRFPQPEIEGFFEAALKGDQSIARPVVMIGVDLEIKRRNWGNGTRSLGPERRHVDGHISDQE